MATDRKDFDDAMDRWEGLYADRSFSVPHEVGRCAFVYSINGAVSSDDEEEIEEKERIFKAEAQLLAQAYQAIGGKAVCIAGVTRENLQYVLTDRTFSDILIVGDGAFSYVYGDETLAASKKTIDWLDVSGMANHLKTGSVVKRTCGLLTYALGVPFATFALQDHSRQYGVINDTFEPEAYEAESKRRKEEDKLTRVYAEPRLTFEDVKYLFAKPPRKVRMSLPRSDG